MIHLDHSVHDLVVVARHLPVLPLASRHRRPKRPEGDRKGNDKAQQGSGKAHARATSRIARCSLARMCQHTFSRPQSSHHMIRRQSTRSLCASLDLQRCMRNAEAVRQLVRGKKDGRRYGLRDATMIFVAFRHGLRVSELWARTWDQFDFSTGMMHVRRIKNGIPSVQQIGGEEMRVLRALKRDDGGSRFVFMTERGAPMTAAGFRKLLARLGVAAKFAFSVHPHMLRHATGYKLANDGHDTRSLQHYLGHKNINHTVRYTELSPGPPHLAPRQT